MPKIVPTILSELRGVLLLVVPKPNKVAGFGEGSPRDMEPAGAGQQLVGIRAGAEKVHQALELARVLGADVGSLAEQVLRVADTTHKSVHTRVAEAGVDEDGSDHFSGWFQQHVAAIGHVHHILHGGFVVCIFAQIDKLAKFKVRREPSVIDCCVFHRFSW